MAVDIPVGYAQLVTRILTPANEIATWTIGGEVATGINGQDAVNDLDTQTRAAWTGSTDNAYVWQPSFLYVRPTLSTLQLFVSEVAPAAGGAASNSAPTNTCYIMRKRTQFVGKSYRGRCYIAIGVGETNIDEGGRITTAALAILQGRAEDWIARMSGVTGSFSDNYLFRAIDPDLPPSPSNAEAVPITTVDIAPIVGTQRRRLPSA